MEVNKKEIMRKKEILTDSKTGYTKKKGDFFYKNCTERYVQITTV